MKYLLSLALKNLFRSKRRTILTFLILSVGIALYIVMVGIVSGYKIQSINNFIQFDTGHIKIRSVNYDREDPYNLNNFITDTSKIKEILNKKPYIISYTDRIQFMAEIDNGRDSQPGIVIGIDEKNDNKVFNLTNYIIKGKIEKHSALIGKNLADDMGVKIGDSLFLTFRNKDGVIDSVEVYVGGVVFTPDPMVNSSTVFITLDEAKEYLAMNGVSEVTIITKEYKNDKKYIKELKNELEDYNILSWRELTQGIEAAAKQDEITTYIFVIFILIIAIVGIINTMLMSVYEKTKEIGTLKAMGMTDREVEGIFVLEGLIIGIAGGIFGLILGGFINWYFVEVGYDMTAILGKQNENIMASLRLAGIIRATWDIPSFFYGFFISVFTSALASYYPAKKTLLMQPAECLRTV